MMKSFSTDIKDLSPGHLLILLEGELIHIREGENRTLSVGDLDLIKEYPFECKQVSESHKVLLIQANSDVHYAEEADELSLALIYEDFFLQQKSQSYLEKSAQYILERLTLSSDQAQSSLSIIEQITQYIQNNLDDKLSIEVICEEFDVNKTKLIKLFKENDLGSVMAYVKNLRFQKAKSLLENSEQSISQIAASCGFVDCASFSHFFKKHADKSPSQIRKERDWLM